MAYKYCTFYFEPLSQLCSRFAVTVVFRVDRFACRCSAYLEGENISNVHQPQYFLELLELVCEQFSVVACAHQVVLASMQRIRVSNAVLLLALSDIERGQFKK